MFRNDPRAAKGALHVPSAPVTVRLREAQPDDRGRVGQLLEDYLFEFDSTTEPYPYLDAYWDEPERLPFLIEADDDVVGLCLIRREAEGWSIAEFSVIPNKRRGGVGRKAVEALAARARSENVAYLEAKVHPDNTGALPFWLAAGFNEVDGSGTGMTVTRRSL